MLREAVTEGFHLSLGAPLQGGAGDGVEGNEVDTAVESAEQAHQRAGVLFRVVDTLEEDVLEGEAALVVAQAHLAATEVAAEIVLLQFFNHTLYGIGLLGRHPLGPLRGGGEMERDGQIAVAGVEKAA